MVFINYTYNEYQITVMLTYLKKINTFTMQSQIKYTKNMKWLLFIYEFISQTTVFTSIL